MFRLALLSVLNPCSYLVKHPDSVPPGKETKVKYSDKSSSAMFISLDAVSINLHFTRAPFICRRICYITLRTTDLVV